MLKGAKKARVKSTCMDSDLLAVAIDSWLCTVGCRDLHMVLQDHWASKAQETLLLTEHFVAPGFVANHVFCF